MSSTSPTVDRIIAKPGCLVYLVGFCMGVSDVVDRETEAEAEPRKVTEAAIIWTFAGRGETNYGRGNNVSIDANRQFTAMQVGQASQLHPVYDLAVREGQAFARREASPSWLRVFIRDGLRTE